MKVGELIEELKWYDEDMEVKFQATFGQHSVDYIEEDETLEGTDIVSVFLTKMTDDIK